MSAHIYSVHGLRFVEMNAACPERYYVYRGDDMIAYVQLRHGNLTVEVPDIGGRLIYSGSPDGDGRFEWYERESFIRRAAHAINGFYGRKEAA